MCCPDRRIPDSVLAVPVPVPGVPAAKQEQLAQIHTSLAAGERPSKQTVANVQAFNKRLLATVDALGMVRAQINRKCDYQSKILYEESRPTR